MKFKNLCLILLFAYLFLPASNANNMKPVIYFIPGTGSDQRLFKNLELDSSYEIKHIVYEIPEKGASMAEYAKVLSKQIDTTRPFVLIGVSLGGMLASEMGDFLKPEKIIVIASAKNRNEMPGRYKFQKTIPIYKLVSGKVAKGSTQIFQPILEPIPKKERAEFKSMIKEKDPVFLRRAIEMMIKWDKMEHREDIVHLHGDKDRTLPIRKVDYDYLIENGSHLMTLTRPAEISQVINEVLLK